MMELAYFYGWSLESLRSMSIYDMNMAREYMNHMRKSQGGEGGKQRH